MASRCLHFEKSKFVRQIPVKPKNFIGTMLLGHLFPGFVFGVELSIVKAMFLL